MQRYLTEIITHPIIGGEDVVLAFLTTGNISLKNKSITKSRSLSESSQVAVYEISLFESIKSELEESVLSNGLFLKFITYNGDTTEVDDITHVLNGYIDLVEEEVKGITDCLNVLAQLKKGILFV